MEPQTQQTAQQNLTPAQWPGAFGLYKIARQATLVNWQTSLLLVFVSIATSIVLGILGGNNETSLTYNLAQLVSVLASVFFTVTTAIIELRDVANQKIGIGEALSQSTSRFLSMLGNVILTCIVLSGSLIAFIIPFFFVLPRIVLSPYYVVAQNMGPLTALKASWQKTAGHAGKAWGIIGVAILFSLLMITIIGIPIAIYLLFMYSPALALLYNWVEKTSGQPQATGPVAPQSAPIAPSLPGSATNTPNTINASAVAVTPTQTDQPG